MTISTEEFERFSAAVHQRWVDENAAKGVTTAISRITGEEQMVPYDQLSETIKDYDRMMVRTLLDVLDRSGYTIQRKD